MAKARTVWRCENCGATASRWVGRCSECGEYGTFVEEDVQPSGSNRVAGHSSATALPLGAFDGGDALRVPIGVSELDRALGGGLVGGSLVLIGGEPGIGKSTLLLQAADALCRRGERVLYVCGEESPQQVALRAARLGVASSNLSLLPELDVRVVEQIVREVKPSALIVDSVQTAVDPDTAGTPGSVSQIRTCTSRFMRIAKDLGISTFLVGHVTKEGAIAGPRMLEHMVDVVLYFEGDRDHAFRIIRSVKNRFGPSGEIGVFEMGEQGLSAVESPSLALLAERAEAVPGSAVMVAIEGTRALLVEIQALVTPSYLPAPRRLATGIDAARLLQVIAVLERRARLSFAGQDVYVSVAGGLRIEEPAADVPLALALASALRDKPVPLDVAAFGELGLTGQVRPVSLASVRDREAARLGMKRIVAAPRGVTDSPRLVSAQTVTDAIGIL